MAGAERLCHIFEGGREMKRLGTTALNGLVNDSTTSFYAFHFQWVCVDTNHKFPLRANIFERSI